MIEEIFVSSGSVNSSSNSFSFLKFSHIFWTVFQKLLVCLFEVVCCARKPVEWNATKKKVARNVGHLRFADLREFHGIFLTKYLRQAEIDFLHGRSSTSVFTKHYFNIALITGLKIRTFKTIREIEQKINNG